MAERTGIQWCDSTANFWIGCTKDGAGCVNCYAEALMDHRHGRVEWGPRGERSYCKAGWDLVRRLNRAALLNGGIDPELGWRRLLFINSLSDSFDPHPSILWRDDMFAALEAADMLDLLLLTKRSEEVAGMIPLHWRGGGWPAHIWQGISVPSQKEADEDLPRLISLRRSHGIRRIVLSIEPMVGPVVIPDAQMRLVDWVIVGGESGKHARPMNPHWVRALRDQCARLGVPFFFKQWGEYLPEGQFDSDGFQWAPGEDGRVHWWMPEPEVGQSLPDGACSVRVGTKKAGRLLDGVQHDARPAV